MANVLIVGESWMSQSQHIKGWDFFSSATYHTGHRDLQAALEAAGHCVTHLPSHAAATEFPFELAELRVFDVVILSDVGANTLLLHPDTWIHGRTTPNRLRLIATFVEAGGGLLMAGGYFRPPLLGLNEVVVRPEATLVASAGGYPLLVLGHHGSGRSAAWTSDIGPHWCSPEFVAWNGYARLWPRLVAWLAGAPHPEVRA